MTIPFIPDTDQTIARKEHLEKLRSLVGNVYPNKFDRTSISGEEDTISNVLAFAPVAEIVKEIKEHISTLGEGEKPAPELKELLNAKLKEFGNVRISGRLTTTPRTMGKAAFVHLSDGARRLQIYVRRDDVKGVANDENQTEVNGWELFKLLDGGDFIGVGGFLFLTNTGELSVHVETIQFLAKAMLPMPDKMHGIADPEMKRRYRYIDLIASSLQVEHEGLTTREVFERRAKLISGMRNYLDAHGYIEVETPILTPKATGAAAKPFETYHNALDIKLYARIAPELYLKRLEVGGFEKVYELNRNFRNEGLSQRHSPEFTMLEFYCAYMDVNGMMDFAEAMIKESVQKATGGSLKVKYGEREIDFSKFERLSMKEAIHKNLSINIEAQQRQIDEGEDSEDFYITTSDLTGEKYDRSWLDDPQKLRTLVIVSEKSKSQEVSKEDYKVVAKFRLEQVSKEQRRTERKQTIEKARKLWQEAVTEMKKTFDSSKNQTEQAARDLITIFEESVEPYLIQPIFIIDYPKVISPLSKASPQNPQIAERFELFINGMECANGFSELNDPQEQYERFLDQTRERERGDDEAMVLDEDYIRALSYGMPPAAGIGIGIDRLVMLLTNQHSIRDVILFPHMRPERGTTEEAETE
jgi:lysyl-tRNA synthetase class 2